MKDRYNLNTLKAMIVNPETVFCYWEIYPDLPEGARIELLVRNLTADEQYYNQLNDSIGGLYLRVKPATKLVLEIGYRQTGSFITCAESNIVQTPPESNRITTKRQYA